MKTPIAERIDSATLQRAADLLLAARLPLVYGLVDATVEAQRESVALADLLGAAIDPATSATHGPGMLALQQGGRVACTLGEVRKRADLVVYWGVDPERRWPGFRERVLAPTPGARPRREIAVDLGDARGPEQLEQRFGIAPDRETEALLTLRALARGRRVEETREEKLGAPLERLRELAGLLTGARYGAMFHEGDAEPGRGDAARALALNQLAAQVTLGGRLSLVGLRLAGNAVGAEKVLTWQTGFPFAVHLGRGYPRYGPGEFTGEALLSRGEADAALLVGVEPERFLSARALQHLRSIPRVVVGGTGGAEGDAVLHLPAAPAERTPGGWYRTDGVGLRRRVAAPEEVTAEEVLTALAATVRRNLGGRG